MKEYKTIIGDDGEKYTVPDIDIVAANSLPEPLYTASLKKEEPAPISENIEVATGGEDNLCEASKLKVRELEVPARVVPKKPVYNPPKDKVRKANVVREFFVANAIRGVFILLFLFAFVSVVFVFLYSKLLISSEVVGVWVVIGSIVLMLLYTLMNAMLKNLRLYGVNKQTKAFICQNKDVYKVRFKEVVEPGTNFNTTKFLLTEAPGQSLFCNIEVERYGKEIFFSELDAYAYIHYLENVEEYNEAYNCSQLDEFYPEWQEDEVFKNFLRDRYQFKDSLFNVKDILEKYIKYQEKLLKDKKKKEDFHKEIKQNLNVIQKYSLELHNYTNNK